MTVSMESRRIRLLQLLRELSVRHGDFTLASGGRSSVYVDAKLTTCRAEAMPLVGRLFLAKMNERGWHPVAVGGLTLGADPIVTAIARESLELGTPIDCFIVRKEPKRHGRQKYLEGLEPGPGVRDVVIVDDVCTKGESTIKAIDRAREAGFNVLGAICLVDREQGAQGAISLIDCPFDRIFSLKELLDAPVDRSGSVESLSTAGALR
jgi:orotate phosphoribosyltransferase